MSRIGKKIITLPEKTEATLHGLRLSVKGPKGVLERDINSDIEIKIEGKNITLAPKTGSSDTQSTWGSNATHIVNMVKGVNEMFVKKLIIEGIGYKADVKGTDLVLALGFSHPVKMPIPTNLKVASDKGIVTITGLDKEEVGQFAAEIRAKKKPEPYKGKGIRYENEVIRRKQGKKSV